MKLSEKIQKAIDGKTPYFSFEYFPPKTEQGLANLYDRIERMSRLGPLFVARTLELCGACQGAFNLDTVMHLTCTNMDLSMLDSALASAKAAGVRNILALRGDAPRGDEYWTACDQGFTYAADLVRYVRKQYGDYFCIGVAGYPEGQGGADKEEEFGHFVDKVNAGADFVVSQLVYDAQIFLGWEKKCREAGVSAYQSFRRLVHLTGASVPESLRSGLEDVKANDQAVKDLGVGHAVMMVRELRDAGVGGVHLTTLNLEASVQRVLDALGVQPAAAAAVGEDAAKPAAAAQAPWAPWGRRPAARAGVRRQLWGRPHQLSDISQIFTSYVGGQLGSLPWSDEPLRAETQRIRDELLRINALGYWTLASQPAIDGVASSDSLCGWGPRGGYVYQKAFVECFVPGELFPEFVSRLQSAAPRVTYYAANDKGDFVTNAATGEGVGEAVTAVTWGVFPGRAVVEPTLIDKMNFLAWRKEAFDTWREWAEVFVKGSEEERFLARTREECWLVNVIDNEYKDARASGTCSSEEIK
ncbi:methylenetetrahydrofolate reductase-domain-containing protein [Kickxella alabastrina]|uniref:methylenetetrahydrofolate reductase-domain-containing protein n=1 Tax=Kickxella alabastrina TaxID=61397 RepID=UPI002220EC5F|nr:methylenetetrahydrofolate reductase-domain-containing protein [Kickxella alabastrina]KAI7822104.1 methylenetetrahydrofolate reductase-domain-containing protein [Kickxella alabastrina]